MVLVIAVGRDAEFLQNFGGQTRRRSGWFIGGGVIVVAVFTVV